MFIIRWIAMLLYGSDAVEDFEKKPRPRRRSRGKRR